VENSGPKLRASVSTTPGFLGVPPDNAF